MKSIVRRFALAGLPVILAAAVACTGPAEGSTPPTISPDVFAPIPTPRPFGQTPTPTATPFILQIPTISTSVTAVPSSPTPSATSGAPGPEPTAPPVPVPTAAPTAQPTQESTATPGPTPASTPEATAEPTATPEPAATPTATPVPVATGGVVFSLEDSSIVLDPSRVAPESVPSGVDVTNFSVAATFGNPVNANFRAYSYGVKFRESGGQYQAVTINSVGLVRHLAGTIGAEGEADSFSVSTTFDYDEVKKIGSDLNSLHLTVIDDQAWLFVNEQFVTGFTVGGVGTSANVVFVAELENETDISGAITELTAVEVRNAEPNAFIATDTLVKVAGEVSRTEPTGVMRDSVAQAEFVSPYEPILGRWSAGFEYVEPVTGSANWLVINSRRQWKHFQRAGATGEVVEIAVGSSDEIMRDRNDVNTLMMLGRNGTYEVFINGKFITQVTFDSAELPARVSAIAGFESSDQKPGVPTLFSNYTVWSLGN